VPILSDDEDDDDNTCVESIALLVVYVEFLQGVRGTFPLESRGVLGEPSIGYLKYAILMELNPITWPISWTTVLAAYSTLSLDWNQSCEIHRCITPTVGRSN
jgi:hypothetical protein